MNQENRRDLFPWKCSRVVVTDMRETLERLPWGQISLEYSPPTTALPEFQTRNMSFYFARSLHIRFSELWQEAGKER